MAEPGQPPGHCAVPRDGVRAGSVVLGGGRSQLSWGPGGCESKLQSASVSLRNPETDLPGAVLLLVTLGSRTIER